MFMQYLCIFAAYLYMITPVSDGRNTEAVRPAGDFIQGAGKKENHGGFGHVLDKTW